MEKIKKVLIRKKLLITIYNEYSNLPTSFRVRGWVNSNWTFCPESVIEECAIIFGFKRFWQIYSGILRPNIGRKSDFWSSFSQPLGRG